MIDMPAEAYALSDSARQIIADCLEKHPDAEWGPGHVVLSDWNVEDAFIDTALRLARAALAGFRNQSPDTTAEDLETLAACDWYRHFTLGSLRDTIEALERLKEIPEDER